MIDQAPRCVVCGREQPAGEVWTLSVNRLHDDPEPDGGPQPICGTACLTRWAEREQQEVNE